MMSPGPEIAFRAARADDAAVVSRLALRSKGHWGYSEEFLAACREELTYSAEQCGSGRMVVADDGDRIRGFHLLEGTPPQGELVALFVDPESIGGGLGGRLLRDALALASEAGFTTVSLDADPDAEPFYRHHGAVRVGEAPSGSVPGRMLPRLRFDLIGGS